MLFALVNHSTLVKEEEARAMAEVCQAQLAQHVAPAWGLLSIAVVFYPAPSEIPTCGDLELVQFALFDDADQAGALGYHSESPDGKPYARVFAKPVLAGGGSILVDTPVAVSVSSVLSHEIIETAVDAWANEWIDGPIRDEGCSYAKETCDPVQGNFYTMVVGDGPTVTLSNFVYPQYFNPSAPPNARLDYLGELRTPLTVAPDGYMIVRFEPGTEKNVFGVRGGPPEWIMATKRHLASRTVKRFRGLNEKGRRHV